MKKGFTLIELLVVITMIGLLSSIVFASLSAAREKARDARRIADIREIQKALELYFDGRGTYPDKLDELSPAYLTSVPVDPKTEAAYRYRNAQSKSLPKNSCRSGCLYYHLGAKLERGANAGALLGDLDLNDDSNTDDGPDGLSELSNCGKNQQVTKTTDLCYDVGP